MNNVKKTNKDQTKKYFLNMMAKFLSAVIIRNLLKRYLCKTNQKMSERESCSFKNVSNLIC